MEIITNIQKQHFHPALGWLLQITLSNGNQYNIYCEWFFDLVPGWNGDPDTLVGIKVNEVWCKNMDHAF